ncbi:hypothetical protein AAU61_17315 [Desulfocarbo indianensis]|nr:hypothetical protein AAU61_17315 [Desulfocarbo indianensis]
MTQPISFNPFNDEAIRQNLHSLKARHIDTFNGILLTQVDFFSPQNQAPKVRVTNPLLEFSFHLTGRAKGYLRDGRSKVGEVSVVPATSLVSYNPDVVCQIEVQGGEHFRALNVYLPPDLLGQLLGEELNALPAPLQRIASGGRSMPFNIAGRVDPTMKMIVDQITNCPFTGAVKRVYLQGKAMELIACRLAHFRSGAGAEDGACKLTARQVRMVQEAKERLLERFDDPPSLASLARQAGMNPGKLTEGFRRLYGVTAYGLLRQERIARAREALEGGQMNITETAHFFGYSDASHFIREFARHYGTTPGVFLKARNRLSPHRATALKADDADQ